MTKGAQLTESLRDLPAAVAGEGQLRRELLVERGMSDSGREIGETITVTAQRQQRVEALLDGGLPQAL